MFSLQNKGCIGFLVTKHPYSAELRITLISNLAGDVSDAIENCVTLHGRKSMKILEFCRSDCYVYIVFIEKFKRKNKWNGKTLFK